MPQPKSPLMSEGGGTENREMTWEHGKSSGDKTKGVSILPLAAPGSHQLPQWAHRPALSHHSVSALWRVPGQNLHLHSGECTSSPLEGTITSPYSPCLRTSSCLFWNPLSPCLSDPSCVSPPGNWRPPHGWNLCSLFSLQWPHRCPGPLLLECQGSPQEEKAVELSWLS